MTLPCARISHDSLTLGRSSAVTEAAIARKHAANCDYLAPCPLVVASTSTPPRSPHSRINLKSTLLGYDVGRELGCGAFSTVHHAICRVNSSNVAVKRLDKATVNAALLKTELCALQRVQKHPNVLTLVSTHEDGDYVYIMTNMCKQGTLFDYLTENGAVSERLAQRWMHDLLSALVHCQERGVVNRDIKPENLLLDSHLRLVVADFGLAAIVENPETQYLGTATGSPVFAAPEVYGAFKKPYHGPRADMWSAGAVLHSILTAQLPFDIDNFKNEWASYTPPAHVSSEAQELLKGLLCIDPIKRLTAKEALESRWFKNCIPGSPQLHPHKSIKFSANNWSFEGML